MLRTIVAAAVLSLAACKPAPKQVLFVCEHGAAKSVIAATYFNELAAARGLSVRATARGAAPQDAPSKATVAGLRADGLVPAVGTPRGLTESDVRDAARVVAFDCDTTAMRAVKGAAAACWNDVPAVADGYGRARDAIRARVAALVDEAARR